MNEQTYNLRGVDVVRGAETPIDCIGCKINFVTHTLHTKRLHGQFTRGRTRHLEYF